MKDFTLKVQNHGDGCRIDLLYMDEVDNPDWDPDHESIAPGSSPRTIEAECTKPYSADGNIIAFTVTFTDNIPKVSFEKVSPTEDDVPF